MELEALELLELDELPVVFPGELEPDDPLLALDPRPALEPELLVLVPEIEVPPAELGDAEGPVSAVPFEEVGKQSTRARASWQPLIVPRHTRPEPRLTIPRSLAASSAVVNADPRSARVTMGLEIRPVMHGRLGLRASRKGRWHCHTAAVAPAAVALAACGTTGLRSVGARRGPRIRRIRR